MFTVFLILIGFGNYSFAQSVEVTFQPVAIIETNLGDIVIEFLSDAAPNHVQNFINLSRDGFYDGTLFHRIIPGFMIQGGDPNTISGDPNTWGQGGPDETLDAEFNKIKHNRGIVSMARSADPNSAGSQFFIVHRDSNSLDEEYTVFGRLVTESSFDTLDKIAAVQTGTNDRPIDPEQVKIIKITIASRADIPDILDLGIPELTESSISEFSGDQNQIFESQELGITFSAPVGWLLQQPDGY